MRVFYTDGACKGNPGPGGFGVVCTKERLDHEEVIYRYSESCDNTTNNREEMKAILHVFKLIYEEFESKPNIEPVLIYSDSAYCVNMINDWIWKWANNNWKNSKKVIVENLDLVLELYKYLTIEFFPCQVIKVNGHCGVGGNELADALATNDKIKYARILKHNYITDPNFDIFKKL